MKPSSAHISTTLKLLLFSRHNQDTVLFFFILRSEGRTEVASQGDGAFSLFYSPVTGSNLKPPLRIIFITTLFVP